MASRTSTRRSPTAYATDGPAIDLGRGVHDGELAGRRGRAGPAGDDEPPRAGRGRDRHRQDAARCSGSPSAVGGRRAGVRRPTSRATCRAWRCRARPAGRRRSADRPRPAVRAARLPDRVPLARRHRPRRAGARDGVGLRAAAAGEDPGRQRDAGAEPRARLPLRRREGAAAARPRRPARAADLPRLRRGQGRAEGIGGLSRATVGVLLRALVGLEDGGGNEFFGEPQFDDRRPAARRARTGAA